MAQGGKLTVRKVDSLKEPGRYGDGAGLWLHIGKTGGKSWVLRYKYRGRAREMGLGSVEFVSLAEARDRAHQARRHLHIDGVDPLDERQAAQTAARLEAAKIVTFAEAAERYIAAHEAGWKNPKHRQQWRNTLATHALPVFGDLPVAEIDTGLVLKALEPVWSKRPETASRLRGRIEAVLAWATARGLRQGDNPARWRGHLDTLLPARSKVARVEHHKAVPWPEMPGVMLRIGEAKGTGARALEFTILTAARSGEVRGMRWGEVDLDAGVWVVPAERMKAEKEHRVPLSYAARAVLMAVRPLQARTGGRPPVPEALVFPGNGGKTLSDMTLTAVLRRLKVEATVHGTARSSFKDWCAEATNYPNEVSEMALAHTVASAVERAYRRGDLFDRRRRLMADWAQFLAGEQVQGEVVAING